MNPKLKPYVRLSAAFILCASVATCNPFLTFLHDVALDTQTGATDLGLIMLFGGAIAVAASGGGIMRHGGFGACLLGAFIALGAGPIVRWLQSMAG